HQAPPALTTEAMPYAQTAPVGPYDGPMPHNTSPAIAGTATAITRVDEKIRFNACSRDDSSVNKVTGVTASAIHWMGPANDLSWKTTVASSGAASTNTAVATSEAVSAMPTPF